MKGKILWTTLLLVAVLSVTFQLHSRKNHLENLLLENMEALAAGELPPGSGYCIGNGSVDYPIGNIKVYMVLSGYSLE